jgi:hypothetical protein
MDWGIVTSVVVGLFIFMIALMAVFASMFLLIIRGTNKASSSIYCQHWLAMVWKGLSLSSVTV